MAFASKRTRSATAHPLFGQPSDLPTSQLPTCRDICRLMLFISQEKDKVRSSGRFPDRASIQQEAANEVIRMWEESLMDAKGGKVKLPIITKSGVIKKIKTVYDTGMKWSKTPILDETKMKNKKYRDYVESLDKLIDICSCKCPLLDKCNCQIRIPEREVAFLIDQRGPRKMFIGEIDVEVTHKWKRATERAGKEQAWQEWHETKNTAHEQQTGTDELFTSQTERVEVSSAGSSDDNGLDNQLGDPDFQPSRPVTVDLGTQNRFRWKNAALACNRYGLSDRAGACVVTATLMDCSCVTQDDQQKVVSHTKLHRERQLARMEQQQEELAGRESVMSFYFDGKKDATLTRQKVNEKWYPSVQLEEHYVVVDGTDFVTHVTPQSGHAVNVAKSLYKAAKDIDSVDDIILLGCDGTNVNTGWKNGVLYNLQRMLGHECQIAVCMLHGNELPFRALFHHYNGTTSGPSSFNGPIGKQIKKELSSKEVENYQAIPFSDFPILDTSVIDDLSWDQKLLYNYCQAVLTGNCPADVALLEPGPVFHSRWLTLWARILRLYMSTAKPSYKLKRLATIIVKYSAPMWFGIKCHPNITNGARHVFQAVKLLQNLTPTEVKIAKKVVQRNAYFAHPEWVLLTMLSDTDPTVRHEAVQQIQRIRRTEPDQAESDTGGATGESNHDSCSEDELGDEEVGEEDVPMDKEIRYFKVPKLNWNATSYFTVINLKSEATSEPPLTRNLSDEELQALCCTALHVPKYPCHTQAVERAIKVVSDACSQVYYQERDGFIRQRIRARKLMPKVNTKKDFESLFESLHIND